MFGSSTWKIHCEYVASGVRRWLAVSMNFSHNISTIVSTNLQGIRHNVNFAYFLISTATSRATSMLLVKYRMCTIAG